MKRLGTDLTSAQKEMKAKHKAYENAVSILSRRLQEALTDKEASEAELAKVKAQVLDGGNTQALQVLLLLLLHVFVFAVCCLNKKNEQISLLFNKKLLSNHIMKNIFESKLLDSNELLYSWDWIAGFVFV